MGFVVLLRQLWRRKWLVALSALLAASIGLLMTYKVSPPFKLQSRAYTIGIASTTAMLDTPTSQVVDLAGGEQGSVAASAGSLPGRAALLANVLTVSPLKDQIAKAAGIDPRTLIAGALAPSTPGAAGAPLPMPSVGTISAKSRNASFLTVTPYEGLPILSVNVTAPDEKTAQRLSNGTIKVLLDHVNSLADTEGVPASRRLVVKQLGDARVAPVKHGPSRKLGALVVVFIFMLLCGAILTVSWIATRWEDADNWSQLPPIDWDNITPEHFAPAAPAEPVRGNGGVRAVPPPPRSSSGGSWDAIG